MSIVKASLAGIGLWAILETIATSAIAAPTQYPLTIDNCGAKVTVEKAPKRAVGLGQNSAEILLLLGLEDRMVGTAFWPSKVLPQLVEANSKVKLLTVEFPTFESILAEDPDFVAASLPTLLGDSSKVAKRQDFEKVLSGYDVVLNSLDGDTLQKSLNVLKPGGKLISISGPPDPDFAREQGLNWFLRQVMRVLSFGIRRKAKSRRVSYSFLFMRANGEQLSQITSLIEAGIIRPVVDRVFPFEATNEALAYIETGRSKGKVIVKLR